MQEKVKQYVKLIRFRMLHIFADGFCCAFILYLAEISQNTMVCNILGKLNIDGLSFLEYFTGCSFISILVQIVIVHNLDLTKYLKQNGDDFEDFYQKMQQHFIAFDQKEENKETNQFNSVKYYLEQIRNNVSNSMKLLNDDSYNISAGNYLKFIEPLLENPKLCFSKYKELEQENNSIFVAAYDAALKQKVRFPLTEEYFYHLLYLSKGKDF